jgi:UDP-glucose 4-epimerase
VKTLVTGGAGFIASHLSDRLVELGHDVVIVDDLSKGKIENLPMQAKFYEMDIRDKALDEVFAAERPEVVFHHAAHADVTNSVRDPAHDASINILGSLNLLECCRAHKVRKFIYANTGGALYGQPKYVPADESHPIDPVAPYGVSKHVTEQYLYTYRVNHGLDYTSLRYPNVYGPRQDPHGEAGVVAIFALQLLTGRQPVIFGDGSKTRDYVYVGDIVEANLLATSARLSSGLTVCNVGTGVETSVNALVKFLRKGSAREAHVEHGPARPGEQRRSALDASRAGRILGWRPHTPLQAGLQQTLAWFAAP